MFAAAKIGKLTKPGGRTTSAPKKKSLQNLKQTQLILTKMENNAPNEELGKTKIEYELFRLNKTEDQAKTVTIVKCEGTVKNVKCKAFPNRLLLGTRSLLGKVDFCLRMNKQFPQVDSIWDIYGKIVNKKRDNISHEIILLMRNDNSGPILQAICHQSYENEIDDLQIGDHVRTVGRFIGVNRFKVYSVDLIAAEIWQSDFDDVHKSIETSLIQLPR